MNIREISKPITAKSLNESLAKKFGKKIALEKFTLEQLQDVRNRLRTTLSQVETNESFQAVQSEAYQKNKLFLDVLNAEITERENIVEASDCDKTCPKSCPDCGGTGDPEKYKEMKEAAKPDFADIDGDGDKKEPMKKAAKDKEDGGDKDNAPAAGLSAKQKKLPAGLQKAIAKKVDESKKVPWKDANGNPQPYLSNNGRCAPGYVLEKTSSNSKRPPMCVPEGQVKRKRDVKEGAEDQAELVMAAKDMVNRVTSWMEDTAEMQTESMLELADAIRDEQGQEKSDAFVQTVKGALESMYTAMESTRESLTQGVGQLTGEAEPMDTMGAEPEGEEPAMEPTVDADDAAGGDDLDVSVDAAAAGAGGDEEAGRAKRESVRRSKRAMLETSRRLGTILSKKK
jgi:hypothetical protein